MQTVLINQLWCSQSIVFFKLSVPSYMFRENSQLTSLLEPSDNDAVKLCKKGLGDSAKMRGASIKIWLPIVIIILLVLYLLATHPKTNTVPSFEFVTKATPQSTSSNQKVITDKISQKSNELDDNVLAKLK